MTSPPDTSPSLLRSRNTRPLIGLIAVMSFVELLLIAADYGLIGSTRWRGLAYQYGGFWAGLLFDWQPNYAIQPISMFCTHSFLHADLKHLFSNMVVLFVLGNIVMNRAGRAGFFIIYVSSVLGGAIAFGLINASNQPMVGASGAIFGLAGAWLAHEHSDRRQRALSTLPVYLIAVGLVVLNLVTWLLLAGQLAWETHLGGCIAGYLAAALWVMRSKRKAET